MAEKIRLEDRECPLSATLGLVGEWWTLLILHDAFDGFTRFDQFQENLGISSSLLTSRLKRLVANGLLERRQYQTKPPRHEYVLTELGRSLRSVIVALAGWGNARLPREQRSMRAARLLYSEILERIEAQDYDVFSRRASVPLVRKLSTVVRAGVGRPLASRAADDRRSIVATR